MTKQITVYSLTTDGDNMGIETTVYVSEEQARSDVVTELEAAGVRRTADGQRISSASWDELSELWSDTFDGCCTLEAHTLNIDI